MSFVPTHIHEAVSSLQYRSPCCIHAPCCNCSPILEGYGNSLQPSERAGRSLEWKRVVTWTFGSRTKTSHGTQVAHQEPLQRGPFDLSVSLVWFIFCKGPKKSLPFIPRFVGATETMGGLYMVVVGKHFTFLLTVV